MRQPYWKPSKEPEKCSASVNAIAPCSPVVTALGLSSQVKFSEVYGDIEEAKSAAEEAMGGGLVSLRGSPAPDWPPQRSGGI